MGELKYRSKYPDIADLLRNTDLTYAEIARKIGLTVQYVHWLNKRFGQFGRPTKPRSAMRTSKVADEAFERFINGSAGSV